ncbi:MAG: hypothetical protein E7517_07575 [Ruminococcaceae bacterium]|nr:hypothetical protein [Oscillospiraceae bacterium]
MSKKVLAVLLMAVVALFALSACKAGNKTTTQKAQSDTSASADAGNTEKKQKESAADKEATEKSGTAKSGNSDSKADSGSDSKAAAGDNSGSKGETATKKGEKTTAKTAEKSAAKKDSATDGWQRTKDGSVVKGEVTADVVNYGKTTVDEGEQLIKELVKAGLSKTKKLSSEKSDRVVTYKYSGKRIGNDDVEYIKFQFIVENGRGYLVTVIAQNQSDMDTDISYLTKNLAKLAK